METDVRVNVGPEAQTHTESTGNKPVKRIRAGGISATIWANETLRDDGTIGSYYTVGLERSYKDKDGAWHNTGTMRTQDLPRASLVLQKAYEWISIGDQ